MKRIIHVVLRVMFTLLCISPILGTLGVFPPPTPDLYTSQEAFAFIDTLLKAKYITIIMSLVFALSIVLVWMNRIAFVAILILPFTVNIVAFHAFLDGGLFTAGAIMGNVLALINIYFLYTSRDAYIALFKKIG